MLNNFVIATNIIGMIVIATIGVLTLVRMKSAKREYFVLFSFCTVLFELGFIMEIAASTVDGGMFGVKVGYIGAILAGPVFLLFTQKYCEHCLPKFINAGLLVLVLIWRGEDEPPFNILYAAFSHKKVEIFFSIFFFVLPLIQCSQDDSINASGWEIATGSGDLLMNLIKAFLKPVKVCLNISLAYPFYR